jgi:hypothetical protein
VDLLNQSLLMYLVVGVAVAVAVYLAVGTAHAGERWFRVATAVPFWPLYLPLLLAGTRPAGGIAADPRPRTVQDEMDVAIAQVDAELQQALNSLDGWAEDVLARERDRIGELRLAWKTQADRIRDMDRLLALPENAGPPEPAAAENDPLAERLRHSQRARWQNIERLRRVRRRAHDDLMGTLAWVRELVSMIHLAKFTGAPAARAEELVAQIAAAVEGLSETAGIEEPVG